MGEGGAARRRWSSAERRAAPEVQRSVWRPGRGGCACAARSAAPGSARPDQRAGGRRPQAPGLRGARGAQARWRAGTPA